MEFTAKSLPKISKERRNRQMSQNLKRTYNTKYFHNDSLYQLKPFQEAFKTIILSNGMIVGLFQGSRGSNPELDFVVKILKEGSTEKPEPPIHTYWVVDLMIKSHHYPQEIKDILDYYINFYDHCHPFKSVFERNAYTPQTPSSIREKYGNLDIFHTLPMDYIALILELFSLCEKQNNKAYMFRDLLLLLKDYINGKADYMRVIKASMPLSH